MSLDTIFGLLLVAAVCAEIWRTGGPAQQVSTDDPGRAPDEDNVVDKDID